MNGPKSFPRYLVDPSSLESYEEVTTDVIVVGGGVAGLSAAIAASSGGRVAVVTKDWLSESNTEYAQGGVAAVLGEHDSFDNHAADTARLAQGLGDEDIIEFVVESGPAAIHRLIGWGGEFDRVDGRYELSKEGGHSHGRILHASGDSTGREIQRAMSEKARSLPRISIHEHTFVLDFLTSEGRCVGILARARRRYILFRASKVIVCTGGSGQLYRETTNPEVATSDGLAAAYRAGAILRGMEFVQFHPTTLYIAGMARILVSETLRGEGGILRDKDGRRFMGDYHPDAELAPRDVVSRSIVDVVAKTGHTNVYLDLTHLPSAYVRERFPKVNRACSNYGIDITREWIPVHPSCHYMIGGIKVDRLGKTNVPGLYAAGEASSSGLHGANRMGSNSLLEGLVYGFSAGKAALDETGGPLPTGIDPQSNRGPNADVSLDVTDMRNSLKSTMWRQVGITRDQEGLRDALNKIETWSQLLFRVNKEQQNFWELVNLMTVGGLVTRSALVREESRGTHFRKDFPDREDALWRGYLELSMSESRVSDEWFVPLDAKDVGRPDRPTEASVSNPPSLSNPPEETTELT